MNFECGKLETLIGKTRTEKSLTKKDIFVVENPHNFSSIGKMVQSTNPSAPFWAFGKSSRADTQKMYLSKALLRNQLIGCDPNSKLYYPDINFRFQEKPKWSFSKNAKESKARPAFAHYLLNDQSTNQLQSFKTTKPQAPLIRFKSAAKVG